MILLDCHNTEFRVRSFFIDDAPCFIASDACACLGLANTGQAISSLEDDEKGITISDTLRGPQSVSYVTESGLYALIFKSQKPEARKFRKWITSEVLPALRRDGEYKMRDVDRERVKEMEMREAGLRKQLATIKRHRWTLWEVPGNVSIAAFFLAAGIRQWDPVLKMRAGVIIGQRCKALGDPVGKTRVRFTGTPKPKTNRTGWTSASTFPPSRITEVLRALGFEFTPPTAEALEATMKDLTPVTFRPAGMMGMIPLYESNPPS